MEGNMLNNEVFQETHIIYQVKVPALCPTIYRMIFSTYETMHFDPHQKVILN
jgi:hypothetical protein